MGRLLDEFNSELSVRQQEPGFDKEAFKTEFLSARGHAKKEAAPTSGLPQSRGVIADVASSVAGGVTDAAEMWARAIRAFDPKGGNDVVRDFATKGIDAIQGFVDRHPFLKPSKEAESGFRRALTEGTRSFVQSASAVIPGLAIAPALGAVGVAAGGAAAVAAGVGALGGATVFGASEKDRFDTEVEDFISDNNLTESQAADLRVKGQSGAIKSALVEGGFELAANTLQVLTLGLFKPFKGAAKGVVKNTFKSLFDPPSGNVLARAAKAYGKVAVTEVATETAQEALETKFRRDIGITDMGSMEAAMSVIAPTLVTSLLFLGSSKGINALDRKRIKKGLEEAVDAKGKPTSLAKRRKAVDAAVAVFGKKDQARATALKNAAYEYINSGASIDLDTEFGVLEIAGMAAKDLNSGAGNVHELTRAAEGIAGDAPALSAELLKIASSYKALNGIADQVGEVVVPGGEEDYVNTILDETKTVDLDAVVAGEDKIDDAESVEDPAVAEKAIDDAQAGKIPGLNEDIPVKTDEELETELEELEKNMGLQASPLKSMLQDRIDAINEELGTREGEAAVKAERKRVIAEVQEPKAAEPLEPRVTEHVTPEPTKAREKAQREGLEDPITRVKPDDKKKILEDLKSAEADIVKKDKPVELTEGEENEEADLEVKPETVDVEPPSAESVVDNIRKQIAEDATKEDFDNLLKSIDEDIEKGKVPVVESGESATTAKVKVDTAAEQTDPKPTEAQIEAGNAKKGHTNVQGLDISIETAAGQERSGTDLTGKPWSVTMKSHYGYIKETKGRDKEHLDAFIGDNPGSENVFVVNQINPETGAFDEHKVMLGFDTEDTAKAGYLENYAKGWKGLKNIVPMSMVEFKEWIKGDTTKELKSVDTTKRAAPEEELITPTSGPTDTTSVQEDANNTSDEELDTLIDGLEPESKKKRLRSATEKKKGTKPKATTKELKEKTATDILAEASKSGVNGVASSLKGIFELFGGTSLKTLPPTFDQATYAKAKPHFDKAFEEFGNAGKSLQEFLQFMVNNFGNGIKPYLKTFVRDTRTPAEREDAVKEQETKPVDVDDPKTEEEVKAEEEKKAKKRVKKEKKVDAPKKVRLKDVGEEMFGKRSQKDNFERIKEENKKQDTGNTNKDLNRILNRATKKKLWTINKEERPNTTPGAIRYLKAIRGSAMGVMVYAAEKAGGRFYGTSKERLESFAGIEDVPGDRAGYNKIAEIVATYENSIQLLDAVTANANTVQEAHDGIVKLLVDEVKTHFDGEPAWVSTINSGLNETGKEVMGLYEYNNQIGILAGAADFIKDEYVEKAEPRVLRRPRGAIKDMPDATSSHRKDNPNPTPQEVLDIFGFRGIEFGDWVNSEVGRRHLNFAFDAFHDLVDILGIPLKGASLLKGTRADFDLGKIPAPELGMAFGSRGFGNFAAHYESLRHIINMTRDNGDGSLAHEWGHALDYVIRASGQLGADAVQDLKNALEVKYDIEKAKALVNEMLSGNSYWNKRRRSKTPVEIARTFLEKEWEDSVVLETDFTKNALAIGGKNGYWNRPEEKWARAFESFILDSLKVSSPYLVNGWVDGETTTKENGYNQGNPYPQGEEREQFSRIFRHFIDGIEWSADNVPSMKKGYEFVAEKERLLAEAEMKKLMAKLDEMFAAMHQGEASKDGLWWYEYIQTKRANLMQPPSIAAFDDKHDGKYDNGFGAVGYTEALLPDDILRFRLKAITHDIDDNKVYLKEAADDTTITPTDRLDTAGANGEGSLGEAQAEDGEGTERGEGVPRSTDQRTGEDGGSLGPEGTGGGTSQRGERDSDADLDTPAGGTSNPELIPGQDAILAGGNYRITTTDALGKGNINEKFTNNIAAIRTLKLIENAGRKASVAEQSVLVQYVGWGGMSNAFNQFASGWSDKYNILQETLTPEEYEAARNSTTTSFYTSPEIINSMYTALEKMGFNGGRILEPAVGTGNFFGLLPEGIADNSQLAAIEKDGISARITKQLYQNAGVFHNSYQDVSLPQNFYDVAISNVPFVNIVPFDPKFNQGAFNLHDYYFVKSLALVRPGGIVAFVTSQGTMDKVDNGARKIMAREADFIGAIRLPDTEFKDAGAKVTADIIFMRKKGGEGSALKEVKFLDVKDYAQVQIEGGPKLQKATDADVDALFTSGGTSQVTSAFKVNEYFVANPEMMLGKMSTGGQFGGQVLISDGRNVEESLREAVDKLPVDIYTEAAKKVDVNMAEALPAATDLVDGNYFEENGKLYTHVAGQPAELIEENNSRQKKKGKIIRGFIKLRGVRRDLIKSQLREEKEAVWRKHIKKLNKVYDAFVKEFGFINKTENMKAIFGDPEDARILALEKWNVTTETATKSGIFFNKFVENKRPVTRTDNVADSLPNSLDAKGRVDLPYMAELSGVSEDEVVKELQGQIWNDPELGWVTSEEYLSGNIKQKIAFAEQAVKSDQSFQKNIDVLTPLIPEDLPPSDIKSSLGASWIEPRDVQRFIRDLIPGANNIHVDYIAALGKWVVRPVGRTDAAAERHMRQAKKSIAARSTWGIDHNNGDFFKLLENILNGGLPTIKDGGVVDIDLTKAAQGKLEAIKAKFSEWIWEEPGRAEKYVRKFNDIFNTDRERSWDGSHLTFPGQVPDGVLRLNKHQRDAVWRALTTNLNVYFAHEVGTGKTYIMASTIMEAKRLGLKKKAILLAVNTNILQIEAEFTELYPAAKILRIDLSESNALKRRITLNRIANEDWDAVIMNHNSFKFIQMSPEAQAEAMEEDLGNLRLSLAYASETGASQRTVKQIEAARDKMIEEQRKLTAELEKVRSEVTFEELGIDMIVVDEAHVFKNLRFSSGHGKITGLGGQEGNKGTFDLWSKTRWINQKYGGGIVFASGTPVTNSVAEIFNIMKYLDPQGLRDKGVHTFDAWAATFGKITQSPEVAPEGGSFRMVTKFAEFINVPELWDMVNKTMDIVKTKDTDVKVPTILGGQPQVVVVPQNEMAEAFAQELVERAQAARSGRFVEQARGERNPETGKRAQDNLVTIITDGRKAAMDMRLIDKDLPDNPDTKVNKGVELAFQAWKASESISGAVLMFADIGVPGTKKKLDEKGFAINVLNADGTNKTKKVKVKNKATGEVKEEEREVFVMEKTHDIFADIKQKLIARGIPEDQIVFPRDTKGTSIANKKKRVKMFQDINDGKARIVIGSTADMGIGVNIQKRLVALVALDTDWNFKNDDQRMGRAIRQGNIMYDLKKPVAVFRVTAEKTVDAFMWGKVADKKKTMEIIFASDRPMDRVVKEISDETANMMEAMARTSGDPRFLRKTILEADVSKLTALAGNHRNSKYRLEKELGSLPGKIISHNERIKLKKEGLELFEAINGVRIGDKLYDLKKDSSEIIKEMAKILSPNHVRNIISLSKGTANHKSPLGPTFGTVVTEEIPFMEEVEVEETVETEVKGKKVKKKIKVKKQVQKHRKELRWEGNDTATYVTLPFVFDTNLDTEDKKQRKEGDSAVLKIGTKTKHGEYEMSAPGGLARLVANTKNAMEREVGESSEEIEELEKSRSVLEAEIAVPFKQQQEFDDKNSELALLQTDLQGVMEEELARRATVDTDLERFKEAKESTATDVDEMDAPEEDVSLSVEKKSSVKALEKEYWSVSEEIGEAIVNNDKAKQSSLEKQLARIGEKLAKNQDVVAQKTVSTSIPTGTLADLYRDLFQEASNILGRGLDRIEVVGQADLKGDPGIVAAAEKLGISEEDLVENHRVKGAYQNVVVDGVAVKGVIRIAVDGIRSIVEMEDTVRHEVFHGVFQKLLNKKDRNIILTRYKTEEKAADVFASYIAQEKKLISTSVQSIFGRMKNFFERLGSLIKGRGFKSADDIFGAAAAGELAEKPSTVEAVGGDVNLSIEKGVPEEDLNAEHGKSRDQLGKVYESTDPLVRQWSQGLVNVVTMNPNNVSMNKSHSQVVEELYSNVSSTDVKWHERMLGLPWFLAKKFTEWKQALGIELKRSEDRNLIMSEFRKKVGDVQKGEKDLHEILALKTEEEEDVLLAIYEGDARNHEFTSEELTRPIAITELNKLDPGKFTKKTIKLSPAQVSAYRAFQSSTKKMRERIIDAIDKLIYLPFESKPWVAKLKATVKRHEVQRARQTKDEEETGKHTEFSTLQESEIPERMKPADKKEFVNAFNKILPKQVRLAVLRRQMGEIKGYAPRAREGKFVVKAFDQHGNTLWHERTEKERETKGMISSMIKRLEAEGLVHNKDFTVRKEISDNTSEFIFDQIQAVSVERFVNKAINQATTNEKISEADVAAVSEEMIKLLSDEFKQRGFASALMKRREGFPIGGYKIENIKRRYSSYVSGASGYITKQIAAFEYASVLRTIDIGSKPDLYEDIAKYSGDMLRNQGRLDRISGRVRTAAFVWYLAGQLKSPIVNFTQNWIMGIPLLEKQTGKGARGIYHTAMVDVARRKYTEQEKQFLTEMQERGITGDQLTQEITGQTVAEAGKAYESVIKVLATPFSLSEIYNRKVTGLARFRRAIAAGDDYRTAFDKSRDFIIDVHFLYGKLNAPSGARGGTPGAVIFRTSLTFRNYTINFIHAMKDMLSEGDFKTVAKSMAYMALLGGASALPFLDGILDILERLTGIPFRKNAKKDLENVGGEILANVGVQGLPALLGVDIGGSLRIHFPDVTQPGKLIEESVFGVYEGLAMKGFNSIKAATSGQYVRAFELVSPTFIERPLKALRQHQSGLTTTRGKIIKESSGAPIIPTIPESIATAFSFRPSRIARLSDNYRQFGNIRKFYSDWRSSIYTAFRLGKTFEARKLVLQEVVEYNRAATDQGGAVSLIGAAQLKGSLKDRTDKRFAAF